MFVKICDRCKKPLERQKHQRFSAQEINALKQEEIKNLMQSLDFVYGNQALAQVDLCEDCKKSFFEWLEEFRKTE